jgi:hypothetical protein
MGHLHPVVVFRDPAGFKITRQVWMRANCNAEALAKILLEKQGLKIDGTVDETMQKKYRFKSIPEALFIMPSFNDLLGGRPINQSTGGEKTGSEALIGPVLRSEAVDVDNSELFLLDGTYLGTLNQLKTVTPHF